MPSLRRDALAIPADKSQISQIRDKIEESPILTSIGLIDFDQKSRHRLSVLMGTFKPVTLVTAINTEIQLTKEELQKIYTEAHTVYSARLIALHDHAQKLKTEVNLTWRHLNDWAASHGVEL